MTSTEAPPTQVPQPPPQPPQPHPPQPPAIPAPPGTDRFGAVLGGLILVNLGIAFLGLQADWWPSANPVGVIVTAVGSAFLMDAGARTLVPEYAGPVKSRVVAGLALVTIGWLMGIGIEDAWPMVLIVAGVAIVVSAFLQSRRG